MDQVTIHELKQSLEKEHDLLVAELKEIARPDPKIKGNWKKPAPIRHRTRKRTRWKNMKNCLRPNTVWSRGFWQLRTRFIGFKPEHTEYVRNAKKKLHWNVCAPTRQRSFA